jgi:crossover junction endodeoxyribonuclease RuvC
MMYKIGIDPGLSGAVALLDENLNLVSVADIPVMPLRKGKNQVNAAELTTRLRHVPEASTAYLEAVSAMPGQGVSSMFSFGTSYGIVQGVLAALGIPVVLVTPQAWKKRAGLSGKDKDMARTLAIRLYPTAELSRKKDIGRADAILIGRFG